MQESSLFFKRRDRGRICAHHDTAVPAAEGLDRMIPAGDTMKLKYVLYSLLSISLLFVGIMGYLFFFASPRESATSGAESVLASPPREIKPVVSDQARTPSARSGKLAIVYSGDLSGNLDPCG